MNGCEWEIIFQKCIYEIKFWSYIWIKTKLILCNNFILNSIVTLNLIRVNAFIALIPKPHSTYPINWGFLYWFKDFWKNTPETPRNSFFIFLSLLLRKFRFLIVFSHCSKFIVSVVVTVLVTTLLPLYPKRQTSLNLWALTKERRICFKKTGSNTGLGTIYLYTITILLMVWSNHVDYVTILIIIC